MPKIYVGNLPYSATDSSLSEFFTNAGFSVASALVMKDKLTGQPRGFGFVELSDGENLERAVTSLNGQALDGRALTINEARPQQRSGGFSGQRDRGGHDRGGARRRSY